MTAKVSAVLDQIEAQQKEDVIELAEGEGSLHFLQKVYRNSKLPLGTRLRAGIEAAQYENPKLQAVALRTVEGDFAIRLDRAIEASNRAKLIEGRAIEVDESR
jgi:hypothetical protein